MGDDNKAGNLLWKNYAEELKDNDDFGGEFKKKPTRDAREKKKTLIEFLPSKKKPFRQASSQRKPKGERKKAKDRDGKNRDRSEWQ